jgi:ABC-2 type transport system permease protein
MASGQWRCAPAPRSRPISHLVSAVRGVMDGGASAGDIWVVLGAAAVLTAVFAPPTVRLYRHRN